MSDHIRLIGADDVAQAARNMQGAADQMTRAAQHIEETMLRFFNMMDERISTLEQVLDAHANKIQPRLPQQEG